MSLSGGQRQRIAIARALYWDPQVLILDEALSSLDSEAEEYVRQVLKELRDQGRTILMITHRLSSLAIADRIIVLDKGKVTEEGTHKELYNREGKYYSLWKKQMPVYLEN